MRICKKKSPCSQIGELNSKHVVCPQSGLVFKTNKKMEKDFHLHPVGTMSVVYNYVPIPKSEGVSVLTGFSPCGATDDSTKGRKRSSTIPSTRSLHLTLFGAKKRKVEDNEDDLLADDKVTQESAPNSK